MLFEKPIPTEADAPIQNLQGFLYGALKRLWSMEDREVEAYGRCYREQADKGYIPQVFVEGVYMNVEFDDTTLKALFFFDVADETRSAAGALAKVDLIFVVNASLVKPGPSRRDDELRRDVARLCHTPRYGMKMVQVVTGYKSVFSRFDGLLSKDQVAFRDTHPLHAFKIGFNLLYNHYQ